MCNLLTVESLAAYWTRLLSAGSTALGDLAGVWIVGVPDQDGMRACRRGWLNDTVLRRVWEALRSSVDHSAAFLSARHTTAWWYASPYLPR
ncbi:MAG: hypothetical protein AAFU38_18780 [Bacteroidota bacterium]